MNLADFKASVFSLLENASGLLPVYFPNLKQQPEPNEAHLKVFVLPANTETLGLSTLEQQKGIVQVSVCYPLGISDIKATQTAEAVLLLFPRGLALGGARIDKKGSISTSFESGAWYVTPVSIPYNSIS
jgi:hypothetical protein